MIRFRTGLIVALGVSALAIPAGAVAKKGENHGKAKGHRPHNVTYVFKGHYVAGEGSGGSLEVERGNAPVRKGGFIGQTVAFDFSNARIVVADTNEDHSRTLDDVEAGDWVLVKARVARGTEFSEEEEPLGARMLIDKTHNPGKQKGSSHHS
jgi:hypothetical protein